MKSFNSHSLEETAAFAKEIVAELENRARDFGVHRKNRVATVVGLSGHLGAGKTAFVKTVAKILGVAEEITSPTFVIMKMYPVTHPIWRQLVHIDAYRLEQGRELSGLKFEELVGDPGNLILVEWPENVQSALTDNVLTATITFSIPLANENERTITYVESPTALV